jgi:rubrerythrin
MGSDTVSLEALSLWFSNYSSLAAKALKPRLAESLANAARSLESGAGSASMPASVDDLVKESLATGYPKVKETAGTHRGALRAFTWGSKVAMILKTLVGRVVSKGDEVLADGQSFHVCDGCGFIYAGSQPPAICPVCKAPASRFAAY